IDAPDENAEYARMAAHLGAKESVKVIPFLDYIGAALHCAEVTGDDHEDWESLAAVYERNFGGREGVSVPVANFARLLRVLKQQGLSEGCAYHLWAVRGSADAPVEGMVSFFNFRGAGFIGYITLDGSLRGKGLFRQLLARIEQTLVAET